MQQPRALITGVTGQDGSYLAELLASKGYRVFGLARRSSHDIPLSIEALRLQGTLEIIHGDIRDSESITRALGIAQPTEIYNLASQSHVGVSFDCREETFAVNYLAAKHLVTTARTQLPGVKIYQASSSEMFGASTPPQNESTPFTPNNPYGESKARAHVECVLAEREKFGTFVCAGILYNHESPRRGKNFVTRKITHSFAKIKLGLQETLEVGNIYSERDWGYAPDYVQAMWQILQQPKPDDYIISTGVLHSVKDFIHSAALAIAMPLTWHGSGSDECAIDENGIPRVRINKEFYRPNDHTNNLVGDNTKAKTVLGWSPTVTFDELVHIMINADLAELARYES
jgi:GDPmannose 4,6-dehydratase